VTLAAIDEGEATRALRPIRVSGRAEVVVESPDLGLALDLELDHLATRATMAMESATETAVDLVPVLVLVLVLDHAVRTIARITTMPWNKTTQ
jgi:hypothetical protein